MKYQPEIDGLRAVSVMSVVCFHLGLPWAQGGFVGVDVFFVISGYLITKLLIGQAEDGQPNFSYFYIRRIRRLAPALLTLIVFCLGVGFFMLSPGDYQGLSTSALYTLFAASNFYFLYNTGYFEASVQSMPLLHTWSLAVEEQFYLIWPVALWLLVKLCNKRRSLVLIGVIILFILSFGLNVYVVSNQGKSGFYLAQYRAWELLVGGFLALLPIETVRRVPKQIAELVPVLGLLAIALAVTIISRDQPYPGFRALLPVIGAAGFLLMTGQQLVLHRVFSAKIPVILGKASYSIYLYHWPIIVFWNHYTSFERITPTAGFWLLIVSCMLGLLSWKLIEQPFRRLPAPKSRVAIAFIVAQLAIATLSGIVVFEQGLPRRIPESVQALASLNVMWRWQCPRPLGAQRCEAGRPWAQAAHRIFLIGDSHAAHFLPLIDAAAERHEVSIRLLPGCSPAVDGMRTKFYMPADPNYNRHCHELWTENISLIELEPKALLVFASPWSAVSPYLTENENEFNSKEKGLQLLRNSLDYLIVRLAKSGRRVILLSDIPLWDIDPIPCVISQKTLLLRKRCARSTDSLDWTFFNREQRKTHELLRSFDKRANVSVISPEDYLCDYSGCKTIVNEEFIYRDSGHLRRNLKPETLSQLARLLRFDKIIAAAEQQQQREEVN